MYSAPNSLKLTLRKDPIANDTWTIVAVFSEEISFEVAGYAMKGKKTPLKVPWLRKQY